MFRFLERRNSGCKCAWTCPCPLTTFLHHRHRCLVGGEPLGKFSANNSSRAHDQNMHACLLLLYVLRSGLIEPARVRIEAKTGRLGTVTLPANALTNGENRLVGKSRNKRSKNGVPGSEAQPGSRFRNRRNAAIR